MLMSFLNRGLAPLENFLLKDLRRTVGNVGKGVRRIWVRGFGGGEARKGARLEGRWCGC